MAAGWRAMCTMRVKAESAIRSHYSGDQRRSDHGREPPITLPVVQWDEGQKYITGEAIGCLIRIAPHELSVKWLILGPSEHIFGQGADDEIHDQH